MEEGESAVTFGSLVDTDICLLSISLNMRSADIFTVSINRGILAHFRNVTSIIFILC